MTKTTEVPNDHMEKMYKLIRDAFELKYKILDVLYPKMFIGFPDPPPSAYDMRNIHQENFDKLKAIRELVEGFHP